MRRGLARRVEHQRIMKRRPRKWNRKQLLLKLGVFLLLLQSAGCTTTQPLDNELPVGTATTADRVPQLAFANGVSAPADVSNDLAVFNEAIKRRFSSAPDDLRFQTSPDGRAIVASYWKPFAVEPATGVWLWPDWRRGDDVIVFDHYSNVEFVSPNFVQMWDRHQPNVKEKRLISAPQSTIDEAAIDSSGIRYAGVWSPSTKYKYTWSKGWAPGMAELRIQRTSEAGMFAPVPAVPPNGFGWLTWESE
jgi:hypothetical protein